MSSLVHLLTATNVAWIPLRSRESRSTVHKQEVHKAEAYFGQPQSVAYLKGVRILFLEGVNWNFQRTEGANEKCSIFNV